jgi:hypothetical protein
MDLACGVVPVEHEAKVLHAFPIDVNLVVLLEYAGEMFDVFFVDVLHSKVVDNKDEADWTPIVMPIPWCDLALSVPCLVEVLGEEVLSYNAGLREAVHPTSHFLQKTLPSESALSRSPYSLMKSWVNNSNFILKYSYWSMGVMR